jgi:hypothetical protein
MRTGPSPKRETQSKKGQCMVSGTNLKSCYCRLNSDHFKCKQSDWEEVLQIPGITNVTLKGNDQSKAIRTCKILLQSLGPKFESLLDKDEVQLDYPFPVVDCLHKFVLTGQLHCQEKDLKALLRAANEFDLAGIKKFGGERLMSFISSETVNRIYQLSKELLCPHHTDMVEEAILNNFQDYGRNETFLKESTPQLMKELLKSSSLNACEEEVVEILMAWAKISANNAQNFQTLVQFIRFGLLEPDFFNTVVVPSELLLNNPYVQQAQNSLNFCPYNETHTLRFSIHIFYTHSSTCM